jgi:glycosyltransferase involved in cell wall biosynthesis
MKITFVTSGTSRTGGIRVLFEVGDRLAGRGHNVTYLSLGFSQHAWFKFKNSVNFLYPEQKYMKLLPPFLRRYNLSDIINHELRALQIPYEIESYKLLAQNIPRDSDITIATFCFTAFAVHRANIGIGYYYIQHYEPLFFSSNPYLYQVAKETYYLPLKWVVNSSWANEQLRKRIGRQGPVVVPGVDANVFFPREVNRRENVKTVISLGKGGKIKGLNYLFKALEIVKKESDVKLKLILYGNEPHLAKMSPIQTEYIINPTDEELSKLYSLSDIAVVPSLYESSPLPPLEAMACGTPVVTTRYGTEDYCFNEVNSLVVPPADYKALASTILRVLKDEDLRENLRKEGLKTAKLLTWDETTNKVERLFIEAIKSNNL